jgi:hypothetical protein
MSGTIETTNNNILTKINDIDRLITLFCENNIPFNEKISNNFYEIKDEYEMGSINILSDYFLLVDKYRNSEIDETDPQSTTLKHKFIRDKDKHFHTYQSFVRKENVISKLDRILRSIKKTIDDVEINRELLQDIYSVVKSYNNSTVSNTIKETIYEMCPCEATMDIDPVTSALVCKECGLTKELYGTVFEDEQFYFQEGQRTKHGTYDPSKHCRFWVERIQARETTEIPEKVLISIKKLIIRDKIKNKNNITCAQIRKYLRQTYNTKYNEHIPLIRKLITGIAPSQLTDHEIQLVHIYFDKVIRIFDEIKPPEKTNCPYHPYFIYKIIEQLITNPRHNIRKLKILACIHLQSRETLIENDRIWKLICGRIDEFGYKPTDRNAQYTEF